MTQGRTDACCQGCNAYKGQKQGRMLATRAHALVLRHHYITYTDVSVDRWHYHPHR